MIHCCLMLPLLRLLLLALLLLLLLLLLVLLLLLLPLLPLILLPQSHWLKQRNCSYCKQVADQATAFAFAGLGKCPDCRPFTDDLTCQTSPTCPTGRSPARYFAGFA